VRAFAFVPTSRRKANGRVCVEGDLSRRSGCGGGAAKPSVAATTAASFERGEITEAIVVVLLWYIIHNGIGIVRDR
jgi:hypothetical protein